MYHFEKPAHDLAHWWQVAETGSRRAVKVQRWRYVCGAMLLLGLCAGCSRDNLTRVATDVRTSAERAGAQAEGARGIEMLNNSGPDGTAPSRPGTASVDTQSGAAASEPPPTPLWLQPDSPYAPKNTAPQN